VALLLCGAAGCDDLRQGTEPRATEGAAPDPASQGPTTPSAPSTATSADAAPMSVADLGSSALDEMFNRATAAVGFSYEWGGGCWDPTSSAHGTCTGDCPSCTHTGSWGADCSGFIAKIWQVPGPIDVTTCSHPYSTANFYNDHTYWQDGSRNSLQRGDAFVYRTASEGHIFLYESGDSWGWVKAYEAKGCSYGIQYNTRTAASAFKPIRRDGV
jgi:cell wall-associated NlpC family hydrolase